MLRRFIHGITSDETLTGEPMRELAHLRWTIENHPFRALNAAVDSKPVWTRGAHGAETWEALVRMMGLTFTLVLAYHATLDPEVLWESRGVRYVTVGYLVEGWRLSLPTAAGLFSPTD